MKITKSLLMLALAGTLFACKQEEKPKVIYQGGEQTTSTTDTGKDKERQDDIRIADLPLVMGNSNYLIHPIGEVRVYSNSSKYSMNKVNQFSYTVSNYAPFELTGYLQNLMFQHKDSTAIRPLTTEKVQIQSVSYLNTIAEKTKKNILVYIVYDGDTNLDNKIDSNDIKTLYISDASGLHFKKLSENLQEVLDWTVIDAQNRLYFRAVEDINKNGAFDKDDNIHYYYVDLLSDNWEVKSYDPLVVQTPTSTPSESTK
ncbi:MAG: hypothetical protein LBE34_09630 [Flavobacteriaceae bacterium]|jgi:hypothetical protein|nr:hypothetical protein [Flavobacteriaceae bacterium]